jgi:acyl carrier protein
MLSRGRETVVSSVEALRDFIMHDLHWEGRADHLTLEYPLIENHVVDSLSLFMLVAFLEEQFGITVSDEELLPENFGTLGAIAGLIEKKRVAS